MLGVWELLLVWEREVVRVFDLVRVMVADAVVEGEEPGEGVSLPVLELVRVLERVAVGEQVELLVGEPVEDTLVPNEGEGVAVLEKLGEGSATPTTYRGEPYMPPALLLHASVGNWPIMAPVRTFVSERMP